jgi:histidine triad (HIT) family protein
MDKNNKTDCVFCKIASGEIPAQKVYEDDNFIVINDANPVSDGHCMIIPKRHYVTLLDMPSSLGTELLSIAKAQSLRLIKEGKAEGFKLVNNNFDAAGQVVKHFHLHIIPEKTGVKRKIHV